MTVEPGSHTLTEITSQPEVWERVIHTLKRHVEALTSLWTARTYSSVIFTGCGSTYYLSQVAAALFQEHVGVSARAYPASEVALLPDMVLKAERDPLLIAVSRSGETTETLEAIRIFRERTRDPIIAVTCASGSTLAHQADLILSIDEAQEQSVAQTRSFSSMLLVLQGVIALLGGGHLDDVVTLPRALRTLFREYVGLARELGEHPEVRQFFFLGSGALHGIANEAMLKLKEMSLSPSEAFHVLEFRHGPMSMVDDHTLVVALISDEMRNQELSVLRHMRKRGARILAIAQHAYDLEPDARTYVVQLPAELPRWARPVLYLPFLQFMAFYRALLRKQNPDQPANLEFVISLEKSLM
ncbi:MAG: SIS domain-containing protein [Anaerolineae bacterium]|nr:SIS domain-containing protein [Anaerolineae bacterium]